MHEFVNVNTGKTVRARHDREAAQYDRLPHYRRADATEKPNVSDVKSDWVDYAKKQGYDPDEGLTKQELIDRYG